MRVCFVTGYDWPPRHGGAELATHRVAERLPAGTTVLCRRIRGGAGTPYDLRRVPFPGLLGTRLAAPRGPCVWHATAASEVPAALHLARRRGGPVVVTLHWLPRLSRPEALWPEVRSRSEGRRQRGARREKASLASCDAVVAVSDYMASLVEDAVPKGRLRVIRNGLDHPAAVPPKPAEPALLYLGRLSPGKGVEVLLEAFARARPRLGGASLSIAGDGDRSRVLAAASDPASGVKYLGYVDGEAKEAAFAAASVLVAPGDEPEPWGLSGLEGMARGRPLVGTATGGSAEYQRDGETGWVVRAGDAAALADALVAAVETSRDEARWRRLSEGALAVARRYSWERNVDELSALYAELT